MPQLPADLQEGFSRSPMVRGTRVYPSTGDSHIICWSVFSVHNPQLPWAGLNSWDCSFSFRRTEGITFEGLTGGFYFHQTQSSRGNSLFFYRTSKVVMPSRLSPVEQLASQITFDRFSLPPQSTLHVEMGQFLQVQALHPVLSWFAVSGSVAVGFAGSFPRPSPSWSKAVGVFPKYCSAGYCRNGHTEPRQVN